MKKINIIVFLGLTVLACIFLVTCDNPIMKKWWVEEDGTDADYDYVVITKDVPIVIYETIIEEKTIYEEVIKYITILDPQIVVVEKPLPPEVMLQYISVVDIEFIIFAGESTVYNGAHGVGGITDLTQQEKDSNVGIVSEMAQELKDHNDYLLILHGHANPALGTPEEIADLTRISLARANAVAEELKDVYGRPGADVDLAKRMTTRGYGGGRNMTGSSSTYAGLNRRVEAILITVTEPVLRTNAER